MVNRSNPIGPGGSNHLIRIISKGEINEVTINGKHKVVEKPVEQPFIDAVFEQIVEYIKTPIGDGCRILLPDVDSGGGTANSILSIYIDLDSEERRISLFLEREKDKSAGTIGGKSVLFTGEVTEEVLTQLYLKLEKVIKEIPKLLGARADARQTVKDFMRLQGLKRNAGNN